MNQLRPILEAGATLALVLVIAALTGCANGNGDDGTTNGPGGAPTETPDDSDDDVSGFFYELVATDKTVPEGDISTDIELAESDSEYQSLWNEYRFEDEAPDVDWNREVVLFIATGESGTCPLNLMEVTYDSEERLITVDVSEDVDEDTPCTDDWTPRAFVIAVSSETVDADELSVSLFHSGFTSREMHREQVRGSDVGGTGTPAPEHPDFADWYDLLETDKTYPEGELGDPLFELAENRDRYEELWTWFRLGNVPPDVDWNTSAVLFAGTGESGSCPLLLNNVEFRGDDRVITIDARVEDPHAMCTMDWTPRVYVIVIDADHLGEGELRAMFFSEEHQDEFDPENAEVIREE